VNPVFDPMRLGWWAKDEMDDFNKAHPGEPRIKSHDFRKRAVTEAHRAGLDVDTAAAAVGMSPATARAYYLAIDQEKAAAVLSAKLAGTLRPQSRPQGGPGPEGESPAT
jgi:integrase